MVIGAVTAAKSLLMLRGDNYNFNIVLEHRQSQLADAAYMLTDMLIIDLAGEGKVDETKLTALLDQIAEIRTTMGDLARPREKS